MPELPEVETTRRQIAPLLEGRRIARVQTTVDSYFFLTPPRRLEAHLPGREVLHLDRIGKYLVARFDDDRRLLLHLGMTGQLFGEGAASVRLLLGTAAAALPPELQKAAFRPDRHTHLRLWFDDGGPAVFFRDARKFGKVQLLEPDEASPRLDRLGLDALAANAESLFEARRGRRISIKSLLLDQSVLAGIGNIYADEALHLAGVRPTRAAGRVTRVECERLAPAIVAVLERSIATGGSSISDYVQPDGRDGGYQDERRVYGRTGHPCPRCGSAIKKKVIGQRSSHYCPRCQL